ncbi:MAG TPA: hypothetical protein VK466_08880 [Terriglobales bacterium]|nr:hypothetical protein [Terriglobales bacterium]
MIFQTGREPDPKPQRKLNWIDAILPTLLAFGGSVLLTYVLGRFLQEYIFMLVFNPGLAEYAALIPLAIVVILILVTSFALHWKATGRETTTSFYFPPVALVWGALLVPAYMHKPIPTQPTPSEISAQELREFKQKLNDPDFVTNVKGPLPMDRRLALISEIDHADGWSSHLKPEQLHALLLNVGMEIEPSIARCAKTGPDDLGWIAHHGSAGGRQGAAMNPNTPEADVRSLLTDPDPEVRYSAERGAAKRLCAPPVAVDLASR